MHYHHVGPTFQATFRATYNNVGQILLIYLRVNMFVNVEKVYLQEMSFCVY